MCDGYLTYRPVVQLRDFATLFTAQADVVDVVSQHKMMGLLRTQNRICIVTHYEMIIETHYKLILTA